MGELRAASQKRTRKFGGGSRCCCCLSCPCCCPLPRPPSPRPRGLHGSNSYRRLAANFEEILRRRLRTQLGPAWCPPSIKNERTAISAQRKVSQETDNLMLTVSNWDWNDVTLFFAVLRLVVLLFFYKKETFTLKLCIDYFEFVFIPCYCMLSA
ncbi:unnamed protein product [Natator depressus]